MKKKMWEAPPFPLCYLCGLHFGEGEDWNKDHVPPKQFYSHYVRRKFQTLNLEWLPTHFSCNKSYSGDENYFVQSLNPLAINTPMAKTVFEDIISRYRKGEFPGLRETIRNEFSEYHPQSGLLIPGKVFKGFDMPQVDRVTWKLIRGLFFQKYEQFLPEGTPKSIRYVYPGYECPEIARHLFEKEDKGEGKNPGVFNYRTRILPEECRHYWMLTLWDSMSIHVEIIGNPIQRKELKSPSAAM